MYIGLQEKESMNHTGPYKLLYNTTSTYRRLVLVLVGLVAIWVPGKVIIANYPLKLIIANFPQRE